jgi:RHS repeat-associated protein
VYTQNLITRFFGMNGIGPDPFGAPLVVIGEEADGNPFRFSTKHADGETGLVYYGYRSYSPSLGRWLSRDPIGEEGGDNLYGFTGNDGINRVDFLGQDYVPMNPPPPCFDTFIKEGKDCCCEESPQVTVTMRDSGTSGWTIRIRSLASWEGCVTEVKWAWGGCDRRRTPTSTPESGFFPSYGCNVAYFSESLFPSPGILNMWIKVRWLECVGNPGKCTRKSKNATLDYTGVWSPDPLDFFRRWSLGTP